MRATKPAERRFGIERRKFLHYVATVSAIPYLPDYALGQSGENPDFAKYPFSFGVASGDPEPDGVVLWTRLAPEPLVEGGGMPPAPVKVRWEMAEDEVFSKIVRQGEAIATPQLGHSVHVEADGLKPDRWYYYRFHAGEETSPVGRTRTTPDFSLMPEKMRFAYASCQDYEDGYYTAYKHMADEDLDMVFHLGDYIYEYGPRDRGPRRHPPGTEVETLSQYRLRYALYRLDEHLQEAHRLFPWMVTWDDHEVDNNYVDFFSEEDGVSPEQLLARRMNGYQAYYEFLPLRRRSFPQGPNMKLYRSCRYGRLANFFVLDTRQYRTKQPHGGHNGPMEGKVFDPKATALGDKQENWLMGGLLGSEATWNVLAQQIMLAPLNRGTKEKELYAMDQWPGYDVSRNKLLRFFHERGIPNPIVLTGDIHLNWVNDLMLDFRDPKSPIVGTEFVGTSISSSGDGGRKIGEYERARDQNDFVKFYHDDRGYVVCEVTPKSWTSHIRSVPFVEKRGAPLVKTASFIVENGRPGAKLLEGG